MTVGDTAMLNSVKPGNILGEVSDGMAPYFRSIV